MGQSHSVTYGFMVEIYTFALVTKGNSGTGYLLDRSPYNSEGHSTLAFCRAFHRSWSSQLAARSLGNRFSVYSSSSQFLRSVIRLDITRWGWGLSSENWKNI